MKYCSHVKTSFRGVGATDFESFSLNTVKLPASQQHAQQVYLQHSILCMLKCISLPIYNVAFMATWKGSGGQVTTKKIKSDTVRNDSLERQNKTANYINIFIGFYDTGTSTTCRFRLEIIGVGWSNNLSRSSLYTSLNKQVQRANFSEYSK